MKNALKARLGDIRKQDESPLNALQEACGEAMLERRARKMQDTLPGKQEGRGMILQIQLSLREDGFTIPMTKSRRCFDIFRLTVRHRPVKAKPKGQD